jgi:hypothetical protein
MLPRVTETGWIALDAWPGGRGRRLKRERERTGIESAGYRKPPLFTLFSFS